MKEGSSRALRCEVSPCFPWSPFPHQHLGFRLVGVSSWDYPGGQGTHSRMCLGDHPNPEPEPQCLRLRCAWARSHSQGDSEGEQAGSLHTWRGCSGACSRPPQGSDDEAAGKERLPICSRWSLDFLPPGIKAHFTVPHTVQNATALTEMWKKTKFTTEAERKHIMASSEIKLSQDWVGRAPSSWGKQCVCVCVCVHACVSIKTNCQVHILARHQAVFKLLFQNQ